ncbi:MAG: hypothetical protein ACI9KE_005191 [Polyangiales bacterium]|jgi:hypothetical protein
MRVHCCPLILVWVLALGCAAGGNTTTGRTDSGPGEMDAATNSDAGVPLDTSMPPDTSMPDSEVAPPDVGVDSGGGCGGPPPLNLMSSQLPRCSAATTACVEECSTGACQMACLEADDTPPLNIEGRIISCLDCLNIQNTACAVAEGCQAEWDAFRCCEADCLDLACAGACQNTHRAALNACYQEFGRSCQPAVMECFTE